jgi:hypothetical protein
MFALATVATFATTAAATAGSSPLQQQMAGGDPAAYFPQSRSLLGENTFSYPLLGEARNLRTYSPQSRSPLSENPATYSYTPQSRSLLSEKAATYAGNGHRSLLGENTATYSPQSRSLDYSLAGVSGGDRVLLNFKSGGGKARNLRDCEGCGCGIPCSR